MLNKHINIIYFVFVILSLFFVILMFFCWNSVFSVKFSLSGQPLTHFAIEKCSFNKNNIYIKGWAYAPNEQYSNTFIYAQLANGRYLPIQKSTQSRSDFHNPFKDSPYNTLGFVASKKLILSNKFTKKIVIVINGEHVVLSRDGRFVIDKQNRKKYIVQYTCS